MEKKGKKVRERMGGEGEFGGREGVTVVQAKVQWGMMKEEETAGRKSSHNESASPHHGHPRNASALLCEPNAPVRGTPRGLAGWGSHDPLWPKSQEASCSCSCASLL